MFTLEVSHHRAGELSPLMNREKLEWQRWKPQNVCWENKQWNLLYGQRRMSKMRSCRILPPPPPPSPRRRSSTWMLRTGGRGYKVCCAPALSSQTAPVLWTNMGTSRIQNTFWFFFLTLLVGAHSGQSDATMTDVILGKKIEILYIWRWNILHDKIMCRDVVWIWHFLLFTEFLNPFERV